MMYLVDNIKLPLNVEEKDIKNAIREKLGLHARSFRYEVLRKKAMDENLEWKETDKDLAYKNMKLDSRKFRK